MAQQRHPINLPNTPGFDINEWGTLAEQLAVFQNPRNNTGIVSQPTTGANASPLSTSFYGTNVGNPGSLVIAPNQSNSGSEVNTQQVVLPGGRTVIVSKEDGVISAGNELVPGGMGMSPNILLNLPDADGSYLGRPVWNYSAMEQIDALPVYQATRGRLLDGLADIVESGEYDFFIVAIPGNNPDASIAWKDTFRTQLRVPEESYLVMIMADFSTTAPS